MIVFNWVTLESVAPVKIEDIRVSPIQYSAIARERAIRGGSDFVRMRDGTRTVSITFALLSDDLVTRQSFLSAIGIWAKTDKEYKLEIPYFPDRHLMCVCTSKPEPSTRQWWESKLRLVFTCYNNPYWNSNKEKSVACGTGFNALGDAPPLMRIEHDYAVAASNAAYSISSLYGGTSKVLQTMTFSTIPAGKMVIDLNKQTAVSGSTDIMPYYTFTSRFIQPIPGNQMISGSGVVKYRERWQ